MKENDRANPKENLLDYIDGFEDLLTMILDRSFFTPSVLLRTTIQPFFGTRASIKTLNLLKVAINIDDLPDCFLLLRKIRDNLIFDCLLNYRIKNQYPEIVYEKIDKDSLTRAFENPTNEGIVDAFLAELNGASVSATKNQRLKEVVDWLNNELKHNDYQKCIKGLEGCTDIDQINKNYLKEELRLIKDEASPFVHLQNRANLEVHLKMSKEECNSLSALLVALKTVFLSYLMLIDSSIFGTDDYVDMLDAGLKPDEGEQYKLNEIATRCLEEFSLKSPELLDYLSKHNSHSMDFSVIGL